MMKLNYFEASVKYVLLINAKVRYRSSRVFVNGDILN